MAPCSLSTGTSSAPGVRRARCTTGPPAISDSLLASARRRPASSVARVTSQPGEADHAVDADVGLGAQAGQALGADPDLDARAAARRPPGRRPRRRRPRPWAARPRPGRRAGPGCGPVAPRATTSKRSGSAATTSSVWVPMEPVDPARAMVVVTGRRPDQPDRRCRR